MRRISGSKLPLAVACPASMALPWVDPPAGAPAIRGTAIHAFLQRVSEMGLELALEASPAELLPYLRSIDLQRLPTDLLAEAAFALNWADRTARFLGVNLGRQYPQMSRLEVPLTIDVVGVGTSNVKILDYKTGRTRYGRPGKFAQTLAAASAACKVYKKTGAEVTLCYIDEHGEAFPSTDIVDDWDIDAFDDALEYAMREIRAYDAGEPIVAVPGDHCQDLHCPAFHSCPAKMSLVKALPENELALKQVGYLAPERLAATWHRLQELRRLLGEVEEEVRACAAREPIDLGNGYELALHETNRETVNPTVAVPIVDQHFGDGAGMRCVTLKVTKSAIEEEAKRYRDDVLVKMKKRLALESKNGTGLLDRLFADVRAAGGVEVKVTKDVTVRKRKALP